MAKPTHCFYRLMTPEMLRDKSQAPAIGAGHDKGLLVSRVSLGVPPETRLTQDVILLRIPLLKQGELKSNLPPPDPDDVGHDLAPEDMIDVTIHINVGMRYRSHDDTEPKDDAECCRISFMVSETDCPDMDSDPHGIGFQVRDPAEFNEWGPYRGIEARVTRDAGAPLDNRPVSYIPDDRGDLGALEYLSPTSEDDLEKAAILDAEREALGLPKIAPIKPARRERSDIPERFEITLKPYAWWGRCATAVEGGHSVSVAPYFGAVDVSEGLYLDVYGKKPGKNFYEIKYVEISIYR